MSGGMGFDDLRLQGQQVLTTDLMTLRPEIIQFNVEIPCVMIPYNPLRQELIGWKQDGMLCGIINWSLNSGVGREPSAPSDNSLDLEQAGILLYTVINRVIFVFRFDCEDSNYVNVPFFRLCDLFPNIPLRRIEFQERWTLVEFHQLVDVLRVNATTTQVRWIVNSGNVTPLSSIRVPEDSANPIVHEGFKSASAGMDPTHDKGYVDRLVFEDETEVRHSSKSFCACIRKYMQVLLRPTTTLMPETSWYC
ncbi:hypothetical protein OUZ56_032902 [Daphnia magna]|uniref:Uncharacterized protein n=1 Tax=Daphnia magna TaxID=35525 RepID=A0ABR0B9V5_9CRUS|nr:hypothetical protein OUZ56_032902 [Daphnia magna]